MRKESTINDHVVHYLKMRKLGQLEIILCAVKMIWGVLG